VLFVLAAVSSVALSGVAEAFVAHEISTASTAIVQPIDPLLLARRASDPVASKLGMFSLDIAPPLLGATTASSVVTAADPSYTGGHGVPVAAGADGVQVAPVDARLLPKLSGAQLFEQLGLLPAHQLATFAKSNPASIARLLASPPKATMVSAVWGGLTAAQKQALATSTPQLVGNLDGIPFAARDSANRVFLATSIADAKRSLASGVGRGQIVSEKHHLEILRQIERTLKTTSKDPARQLLTFDPAGDARAAVVVGNLSTADYVSYLVPGMFFTVQGQMYDWTTIAQDLHTEQAGWLKILAKSDPSYQGKTSATVAWIGYSTPGVLDIASLSRADEGANILGNAIEGVKAVRAGSEPFVSLVTHSYGSTTAMIELAKGGVSVDALAMIGSPGAAAHTASALSVKNDNVFVGEAAWDPVVNTAFYGSDPGSASFGAHTMDVAGGTDAITHKKLSSAVGHLGYFDAGSEAMRNLALVGLNQSALVSNGTLADAKRTLASQ
jgi:hypothetical protein